MNRKTAMAWVRSVVLAGMALSAAAWGGEASLSGLVLSDAKEGKAKSIFAPKTPKIFLSGKMEDMPGGGKLKVVWIAEKTKAAPPNSEIDSTQHTTPRGTVRATFALNAPTAGWPVGDYRVDLFLDGKLAGSHRFSVK